MKNSELVKIAYQSEERKEKTKKTRIKNGVYVVSEEMKRKISETLKNKNLQSAVSIIIEKYSLDGELISTYPSIIKAELDNDIGRGCLYYNLVKNKKEVYKNFKWNDEDWDTEKIMQLDDKGKKGYLFSVSLHLPDDKHDYFNNYPLCPQNISIQKDDIKGTEVQFLNLQTLF
jgi:hypothetical protein